MIVHQTAGRTGRHAGPRIEVTGCLATSSVISTQTIVIKFQSTATTSAGICTVTLLKYRQDKTLFVGYRLIFFRNIKYMYIII